MKEKMLLFCRALALAFLAVSLSAPVRAQQVQTQRRSNTLFVFPEFQDAKILQSFGRSVTAKANILLKNSTLCYLDSGKVMQAYLGSTILGVEFNDSVRYQRVDTVMGRVIAEKNWRSLVVVTTIDMDRYKAETTGGDNLPFFEIPDLNVFLEIDGESRDDAKGYPLKDTYYFIIDGVPVRALEKNIKKYIKPEMKTAFKNLMGDRFWSWNDPSSLISLLGYI